MNQKHCASFERDAFYASQRPNARSLSCSLQDARAFLPNFWLLGDPGNTQQYIISSSNGKGVGVTDEEGQERSRGNIRKAEGIKLTYILHLAHSSLECRVTMSFVDQRILHLH